MRAMRVKSDDGNFSAIVGDAGRIFTAYVKIDSPSAGPFIRKYKMANGDIELYAKPLMRGIDPYPLKRAVNNMLRIGRMNGITKAAKTFLMEAKQ